MARAPRRGRGLMLLCVAVESDPVWGSTTAAERLSAAFARSPHRELLLRRLAQAALAVRPPTGFRRTGYSSGAASGRCSTSRGGACCRSSRWRAGAAWPPAWARPRRARGSKRRRRPGRSPTEDAPVLRDAFELVCELRMEHQVDQLRRGEAPDNLIDPSGLMPLDAHGAEGGLPGGRAHPAGRRQRLELAGSVTGAHFVAPRPVRRRRPRDHRPRSAPRRGALVRGGADRGRPHPRRRGRRRPRPPEARPPAPRSRSMASAPPTSPRPRPARGPRAARRRAGGRIPVAHAAWVERASCGPRLRSLGPGWRAGSSTRRCLAARCASSAAPAIPGWCGLSAVAAGLRLPAHRPHDAVGDALTTAQAFLVLATDLEAKRAAGRCARWTRAEWGVRAYRLWHPPAQLRLKAASSSRWKSSTCSRMIVRARSASPGKQGLDEVRLVVDRVAEPWQPLEHEVPDAQGVGEVALQRLLEVRVPGGLPREAVDALVEAHQPVRIPGLGEVLDLAQQRLGGRAMVVVEAVRRPARPRSPRAPRAPR